MVTRATRHRVLLHANETVVAVERKSENLNNLLAAGHPQSESSL